MPAQTIFSLSRQRLDRAAIGGVTLTTERSQEHFRRMNENFTFSPVLPELYVSDLDRSLRFYTESLGFSPKTLVASLRRIQGEPRILAGPELWRSRGQ
jgi:hypothetical protein